MAQGAETEGCRLTPLAEKATCREKLFRLPEREAEIVLESRFASQRERRLWIWTTVLIVGIYSTLGLASTFAQLLNNQLVAAIVFVACMLLVALTILTQGLKVRPRGVELGVGLGIAVVYTLLLLRLTLPERSHLMEYGVVAVFMYEALTERKRHGRPVPIPAVITVVATSAVGAIDECIQLILPSRVFDVEDILFNFLAALFATAAMVVLGWARRMAARVFPGHS